MPEGPLILVADDDEDVAYLVGLMLSDAGYRVTEETTLAGVERRLARDPLPAALVLDVKMGTEDASLLVERVRASARTRHLPVLLMSARIDVTAVAYDAGTTGLAKPFSARTLVETVAQTLGRAALS